MVWMTEREEVRSGRRRKARRVGDMVRGGKVIFVILEITLMYVVQEGKREVAKI
jgi:hypothetical protein